MSFKVNTYEKSRAAFDRALKVIPSGIYGHQPVRGCYIPNNAFPLYSSHAKGSHFWMRTVTIISTTCAVTALTCWATVMRMSIRRRSHSLKKENCVTIPSSIMVDFAELLVDTVASADWAFFAKNGNDVTSLAVMTARAATHRKKIVFFNGYYHAFLPGRRSSIIRACWRKRSPITFMLILTIILRWRNYSPIIRRNRPGRT